MAGTGLHPSNVHDCEYAIGAINVHRLISRDSWPKIAQGLGGFVCPVTIAEA